MPQGFDYTKRRVAEAKQKKREQKRLRRQNKSVLPNAIDTKTDTKLSPEEPVT